MGILGCSSWRKAECSRDHKCVCLAGTCNLDGACETECTKNAGGSCHIFGCSSSRGETDCIKGHCYCKAGTCKDSEGKCAALDPGFLAEDLKRNYRNMSLSEVRMVVQAEDAQRMCRNTVGIFVMCVDAPCSSLACITRRQERSAASVRAGSLVGHGK